MRIRSLLPDTSLDRDSAISGLSYHGESLDDVWRQPQTIINRHRVARCRDFALAMLASDSTRSCESRLHVSPEGRWVAQLDALAVDLDPTASDQP